jgi:hypothetical protein
VGPIGPVGPPSANDAVKKVVVSVITDAVSTELLADMANELVIGVPNGKNLKVIV